MANDTRQTPALGYGELYRVTVDNESLQDASAREAKENADRVAANPEAASEKDLRRAAGYLDQVRRSYVRKAQRGEMAMPNALLDSIDVEIANYDRLANELRDADRLDTGELQTRWRNRVDRRRIRSFPRGISGVLPQPTTGADHPGE